MILVHVWDATNCVLRLAWRSAAAARRLKPLALATTIACTGITVYPPSPPVEAHPPPPPAETIVAPPPPVGYFPPPWSFVPPANSYTPPSYPIPVGPVLPGPGVRQTEDILNGGINIAAKAVLINEGFDTPPPSSQTPICNEDVPSTTTKTSEPGVLSVFVMGLLFLLIWYGIPHDGSHLGGENE